MTSTDSSDGVPRVLGALATFFHWAGAALLGVMTALICADAGARILFNAPFAGTTEIVAALVVVVTCLQLPYVLVRSLLLRVTFVLEALPPRVARLFDAAAYAVGLAFFAAITAMSVEPLLNSVVNAEYEGTMTFPIPLWPLRLVTCVLWGLSACVCLALVADALRRAAANASARAAEEVLA